jgi:membrane fusion protein, multidrug efflux system
MHRALGLLAACALGLLAGCAGNGTGTAGDKETKGAAGGAKPGAPAAASRAARVAASPVTVRDVTYTVEAVGSIEATDEVRVVAGVEGVVTTLRFQEGDAVGPSTVLATIDPERYRVQAERAKANFEKIDAQYRQAESDLRRREELSRQATPLISDEDVERARQEAERLRASVAEARAQYELAEQDRQRSIVRPLLAGVINSKSVTLGQHVESKDALATLVDMRSLDLRFRISEQESTRIKDGMEVRFVTASRPGQEFKARVFHVSSTADPSTRMVECLARVRNAGGLLKPGFFAEVKADVESHLSAIVIPERAVRPTERGFVVFEVVDGKAVERQVSLGLRTKDGGVEILSGLGPKAVVVTDGGDVLRDGAPVQSAQGES